MASESADMLAPEVVLEFLRNRIAEARPRALSSARLVVGVISTRDGLTDWSTIRIEPDAVTLEARAPSVLDKAPRVTLVARDAELSDVARGRPRPLDITGDKRVLSMIASCFSATSDLLSVRARS